MYVDIVMPDGNEEEFIALAEALGYEGLCFFYPGKFSEKKFDTSLKIYYASAKSGDLKLARASEDFCKLVERSSVNVIFDLELLARRDSLHFRKAGLNQVLAPLMNKKNVALGMSFNSLLKSPQRCQVMGRMQQNIRLALKYDAPLVFASFATKPYEMRAVSDLVGLLVCLGLNPKQAKDAIAGVSKIISENKRKKSASYICEGVTLVEE